MYTTLSGKEKDNFFNLKEKSSYKLKGHSFKPMKGIGKQHCSCCGLVALRNPLTDWCIKKGCNASDHPQYNATVKRLTKGLGENK